MQPGQLKQALASAVDRRDAASVEALIRRGADVNAKFDNDVTLLHIAVQAGEMDMARLLVANGADIHIPNRKGVSPLELARVLDGVREINGKTGKTLQATLLEAFSQRHTKRVKAQHQLRSPAPRP